MTRREYTQHQLLEELEPAVAKELDRHLAIAKDWMPHEYVPWTEGRNFAGVGTFFMSEVLFLRGVTPWTPVRDVPDLPALVALVHRLLDVSRVRGVQVTTGDMRPGRSNYVHARSGRPCLRCRTPIRVASIGVAPQDRVAFYCPHCQRGPAPTDDGRPQRPLGASRR